MIPPLTHTNSNIYTDIQTHIRWELSCPPTIIIPFLRWVELYPTRYIYTTLIWQYIYLYSSESSHLYESTSFYATAFLIYHWFKNAHILTCRSHPYGFHVSGNALLLSENYFSSLQYSSLFPRSIKLIFYYFT